MLILDRHRSYIDITFQVINKSEVKGTWRVAMIQVLKDVIRSMSGGGSSGSRNSTNKLPRFELRVVNSVGHATGTLAICKVHPHRI